MKISKIKKINLMVGYNNMDENTLSEIREMKSQIKSVVEKLKSISSEQQIEIKEIDIEFLHFILKKILFFKNLYLYWDNEKSKQKIKNIVSDLFFLIFSIFESKERYSYLNIRSIIENFARLIVFKNSLEDEHITKVILAKQKEKISEEDYSFIVSEYRICCEYIHGGTRIDSTLILLIQEYFSKNKLTENRNKFYERLIKLIIIYEKVIITEFPNHVSGIFHRRKEILKFLIGDKNLELLFNILDKKSC